MSGSTIVGVVGVAEVVVGVLASDSFRQRQMKDIWAGEKWRQKSERSESSANEA